jgi:hypothetical protein
MISLKIKPSTEIKMNYKNMIIGFISVVLFFGLNFCLPAQDDPAEDRGAEKSHQSLKKMPKKLLKMLGLSTEEAAKTTRGKKLKVFMVGLDKLKTFKPGDNTKKILIDTNEIVYPVYVDSVLKTSLSIRKRAGGWKNASMGGSEIRFLEPVRKTHAKANKINETAYFIVRVPAMYLNFLGYYKKGDLYLIPTHEHPDLELDLGKGISADDVYIKIQPLVDKFKNILTPPK